MGDVSDGAQALYLLANRLRDTGDVGLRRELDKAIRDAAGPLPGEIREGLPGHMPNRYAAVLDDDLRVSISERTTDTNPGVRIVATGRGVVKRRRMRRLENGVLEHPLFGNRKHWYKQPVQPGWFSDAPEHSAPQVRDAILHAMSDIKSRVEGRI